MPVTDDVLARAKDHDTAAMEAVVADSLPHVYRMAIALTGREGVGRQVVHSVVRQSLRVLPRWRVGVSPENWYYHHTVLTARAAAAATPPPDPHQDALVPPSSAGEADYLAFVRALRNLPRQQAEAFILHHGERLNDRLLGVAMDCSTEAAGKHLEAATQELAAVTGGQLDTLASRLSRAYGALAPAGEAVTPAARRYVHGHLRPRRFRRVFSAVAITAALLLTAYLLWTFRDPLLSLLSRLRTG